MTDGAGLQQVALRPVIRVLLLHDNGNVSYFCSRWRCDGSGNVILKFHVKSGYDSAAEIEREK